MFQIHYRAQQLVTSLNEGVQVTHHLIVILTVGSRHIIQHDLRLSLALESERHGGLIFLVSDALHGGDELALSGDAC